MQASLLEEIAPVPNPYPIRFAHRISGGAAPVPAVRELARDPWKSISATSEQADIQGKSARPAASGGACGPGWSTAPLPYGAERLRDAIFAHQPLEIKRRITNFIPGSCATMTPPYAWRQAWAATRTEPRADYFKAVIPKVPRRAATKRR